MLNKLQPETLTGPPEVNKNFSATISDVERDDMPGLIHEDSRNHIVQSTMSPSGRQTIDYGVTSTDDRSTLDMTHINSYKSAAKIRADKRKSVVGASPKVHNMQAKLTQPGTRSKDDSSLPNVRGASNSRKTIV